MKNLRFITLLIVAALSGNMVSANQTPSSDVVGSINYLITLTNVEARVDAYLVNVKDEDTYFHKLGQEIAKRMTLLTEQYTYETKAAPGAFSGKLIVEKPIVYNSILKVEKYLTRHSDKNSINAKNELKRILNIGILLRYENTDEIEKCLAKANSVAEIIDVFNRVKVE